MEVFQNKEKVLVKSASKTYEFDRTDTLSVEPMDNEAPPQAAIDALESEGFTVGQDKVTFDMPFDGPYERGEAAHVLGFDVNDERFERFLGAMKYGVDLNFEIEPDGTTWITAVSGTELSEPIQI